MKIPFRQGIVQYQTDNNKSQQFLQKTGSSVTLNVSPTPTIVAFAHLDTDYLYTEGLTIQNAWSGPFVAGTNYWLYWDLNPLTGLRTFGHTTLAPIVSSTMPRPAQVGQHWFDTTRHCMNVWNGSVWNIVVRVFAAKYTSAASFEKMSTSTNIFSGSQVGDNSTSRPGALVFDVLGKPLKTSHGTFYTSETGMAVSGLASAVKLASVILTAEAQEPIPAYSAVYFSDFDKINLCKPMTPDTLPYGIVEVDMVQGIIANVLTSGLVVNNMWNWTTVNQPVYVATDGSITTTKVYGSQTSIGYVLDRNSIVLHQTSTTVTNGSGSPVKGDKGDKGDVGPAGPRSPFILIEPTINPTNDVPVMLVDNFATTEFNVNWYIYNTLPNSQATVTIINNVTGDLIDTFSFNTDGMGWLMGSSSLANHADQVIKWTFSVQTKAHTTVSNYVLRSIFNNSI